MNPHVEPGIKAYQARHFTEAIACFERALAVEPADPRIQLLMARSCHQEGLLERAREHYEQAVSRAPAGSLRSAAEDGLAKINGAMAAASPARPKDRRMPCPHCGETVLKEACVCGFVLADPERLALDLVQAYCEKAQVIVAVRVGLDTYLLDWDRVSYRSANQQLAVVDPRLIFRPLQGRPMIRKEDLQLLSPYRTPWVVYPRPGKEGEPRPYAWEAFMEVVGEGLGRELPEPLAPFDASHAALTLRMLPPAEVARFEAESRRRGLSFAQELLRVTNLTAEAFLQAMQGGAGYFMPAHRMSNSVGWDLMADALLSPDELRALLSRQVDYPKPMFQLVLAHTPLSEEEVEPVLREARERRVSRPQRDRLGEILVRHGGLSRARLDSALEQQTRQPQRSLGEILRADRVAEKAIDEALHRQRLKDQFRFGGQVRLGEILVKRGSINRQQLLAGLLAQVEDAAPLGELLIRMKAASPEQIFLAIEHQETSLDALVENERTMELQDAGGRGGMLNLSIDLDREKQRINKLWGSLKSGFQAGVKDVRTAIETAKEAELARARAASRREDGE